MKAQDRVAKDGEIVVRERRVRAFRNEEFRGASVRRQEKSVFRPPVSDRVLGGLYRVRHLMDGPPFDRLVDRIALELFHVPGAVDLEMGPQLQEAVVGHDERAALDREDDQRPFVRVEVMGEQGEPIRISFRRASEAEERRIVEGIRVAHRCGEGFAEDERSRETGTLKRTAFMVPPAVSPTKLDEAKAALERGAFEEALRLIEVANSETPDDTETRELYAVTHLAKAIRLSEEARKARQAALGQRKIEYEEEFQDDPQVSQTFDEALAAIEDVLRVEPLHWKARMLKASLLFRRDRESGRPQALAILHALAVAEPTNKQVPFAIRKIERPCERCGDTGFCPHCKGRGHRQFLGLDRKCERCYGRGICPACGVL